MAKGNSSNNLKVSVVYFLIYLLITIILSILYTAVVLYFMDSIKIPLLVKWLIQPLILLIGVILGSFLVKRWFLIKNPNLVIIYSTVIYFFFELLFVIRDFLITEINGMWKVPIKLNIYSIQ